MGFMKYAVEMGSGGASIQKSRGEYTDTESTVAHKPISISSK
jgi:hypothetical protein